MQSRKPYRFVSEKPEATVRLGQSIGARLQPGAVVSLIGELGSGKTTLVKGIARSLGVEEEVTSPSFTIMSVYQGRTVLYHVDLYRINDADELDYLGLEDVLAGRGVCVIEWGEKAEEILPEARVEVRLRMLANGAREIKVRGAGL